MPPTRPVTPIDSRERIRAALESLLDESVGFWRRLPTPEFFAPIGAAWSPAENVRHLTKSMRAVTRGLRLPTFVVRLSFGGAPGRSRSYEEVRAAYLAALVPGVTAGAFTPEARPVPADPDAERRRIMEHHAAAVRDLGAAVERWSERQLERCRLPHPLLGPITVREMLHFTLYHNRHHLENVRRRLATSDQHPPA